MPELKLGSKFECYSCGTKFYDLGKSDPLCPKCGANQKDAANKLDAPAGGQAARRRRKADVVKAPVELEEEVPIEDIDEEVVPEGIEADLDNAEEEEEELDDEA